MYVRALCRNSAVAWHIFGAMGKLFSLLACIRDVVGAKQMGNGKWEMGHSCLLPRFQSLRRPLPAVRINAAPGGTQDGCDVPRCIRTVPECYGQHGKPRRTAALWRQSG